MNTARKIMDINYTDNVVSFPGGLKEDKQRRSDSRYKSNGQIKASAAEPIEEMSNVHKMLNLFLDRKQYRNYLLLSLGINFALRAGDLLKLRIEDLYEANGTAKPYFEIYEKKTGKHNKVAIPTHIQQALNNYFIELPEPVFNTDPLFESRQKDKFGFKKPITIRQVNNILKNAAKECGLDEHISSHSMRKTYGYQMMKANDFSQDVLYALQYTFNHSDIRTTFRYTGLEQKRADELREQMGNMLFN